MLQYENNQLVEKIMTILLIFYDQSDLNLLNNDDTQDYPLNLHQATQNTNNSNNSHSKQLNELNSKLLSNNNNKNSKGH